MPSPADRTRPSMPSRLHPPISSPPLVLMAKATAPGSARSRSHQARVPARGSGHVTARCAETSGSQIISLIRGRSSSSTARSRISSPSNGERILWKSSWSGPDMSESIRSLPACIRPMLHPLFTPEHEVFRSSVRRFVESELASHTEEWEREGRFPDWVFKRMGDLGFLGVRYPERYGGQGGDWGHAIVVAEEMARTGSGGVGMAVAVQSEMATPPILKFGTEEQKQRYLVPAIRGEKIACLGITEPGAGSDVASIDTVARRDGDSFVINGRKMFITNGARADACLLVTRTDKGAGHEGFSLFIVDTDLPGFTVGRELDKLGMRTSDTAE